MRKSQKVTVCTPFIEMGIDSPFKFLVYCILSSQLTSMKYCNRLKSTKRANLASRCGHIGCSSAKRVMEFPCCVVFLFDKSCLFNAAFYVDARHKRRLAELVCRPPRWSKWTLKSLPRCRSSAKSVHSISMHPKQTLNCGRDLSNSGIL